MRHNEKMIRKSLSIILLCTALILAGSSVSFAQERTILESGLEQRDFFDPTKKETKVENYNFGLAWHLEGGYAQDHQRMTSDTISALYLHGARIGAQVELFLPKNFSVNIGLLYTVLYGISEQHYHSSSADYVQTEYIKNHIVEHALTIPVRVQYNIPLWKQLSMHFYTGPQLMIGLAQTDYVKADLSPATALWLESQGKHLTTYDKYVAKDLIRTNVMYGLGGGFTWDVYRIEAGYDFGLNNLLRTPVYSKDRMSEWQWHVSFVYTL